MFLFIFLFFGAYRKGRVASVVRKLQHTHKHTHTQHKTHTRAGLVAHKRNTLENRDFSGSQARAHTHGMEGGLNLDGVDKVDLEAERLHRKDGALVPNIPVDLLFFGADGPFYEPRTAAA